MSTPVENTYAWLAAQLEATKQHVEETWPDWMKNTSDVAVAAFPCASVKERNEWCLIGERRTETGRKR